MAERDTLRPEYDFAGAVHGATVAKYRRGTNVVGLHQRRRTSGVEVTNVSPHGLWLLVAGEEKFLSFKAFPWFQDAPIRAVMRVERPSVGHLYWPALDVDLAEESIDHPERFPLLARPRRGRLQRQAKSARSAAGIHNPSTRRRRD